jgi:hypothetical protein
VGLKEEYGEKVNEVEESVQLITSRKSASRLKAFLDSLLPFALILMSFVVLFQFFSLGASAEKYIGYFNWIVIVFFAARLGIGLRLAKSNKKFVKNHWLDALMVIPALTLAKELRLSSVLGEEVMGEKATTGLVLTRNLDLSAKMTRIVRIIKRSFQF